MSFSNSVVNTGRIGHANGATAELAFQIATRIEVISGTAGKLLLIKSSPYLEPAETDSWEHVYGTA